jgi:signal transduction histidine kinase
VIDVEANDGRIWAESPPEDGTRVSFTLPAVV